MIIKNINKEIQQSLRAKERAFARKNQSLDSEKKEGAIDFADLASRTSFVRMVSNKDSSEHIRTIQGGELVGAGTEFGFGTDSDLYMSHGFWSGIEEYYKPISGLTSISVEYAGGYKAIRKAVINWTVPSINEIDDLTPHFLTQGKTVLVDWGWIIKSDPVDTFYKHGDIVDQSVFTNPMPKILANKGNYDAIGGVISNFEYSMNEAGGFDCVTNITSIGNSLFDSQRVDKGSDDIKVQVKITGEKDPKLYKDGLVNALVNFERILLHDYFGMDSLDAGAQDRSSFHQFLLWSGVNQRSPNLKRLYDDENAVIDTGEGGANFKNKGHAYLYTKNNGSEDEFGDVFWSRTHLTMPKIEGSEAVKDGADRQDFWVRWGWFEDNILSRYTSFVAEIENEEENNVDNFQGNLTNVFRSIEPDFGPEGELQLLHTGPEGEPVEINSNGGYYYIPKSGGDAVSIAPEDLIARPDGTIELGSYKRKSVRIRNNPNYLLPIDPMKFFLPGQTISWDSINIKGKKNGYAELNFSWWEKFLSINAPTDEEGLTGKPFRDPNNEKYGLIRNVMVNVKEIKKAFGIQVNNLAATGTVYGSDKVTPPVDIKAGVMNLLNALSANFHNFWKFEIVEDPYGKNMKIVERDSSYDMKNTVYTKFVGDVPDGEGNVQSPSHEVQELGIYKFPTFTLSSMVKSQNLSFKIPDSMAVTTLYGSNKSKQGGIALDTSNDGSNLETVFQSDKSDKYSDKKLRNLQKSYLYSPETPEGETPEIGHKIGNVISNPSTRVTLDGSDLTINPNNIWWSNYSVSEGSSAQQTPEITGITTDQFSQELLSVLQGGVSTEEYEKEKKRLAELKEEANIKRKEFVAADHEIADRALGKNGFEEEGWESQSEGMVKVRKKRRDLKEKYPYVGDNIQFQIEIEAIAEQEENLTQNILTGNTYWASADSEDQWKINILNAGLAIVRQKLFSYDKASSVYQTNFIIPAELTLEIDGVAGITPGEIIQTEYIQPKYNKSIVVGEGDDEKDYGPFTFFQIFNINQKVDGSGWFTELTTKMRINSNVLALDAKEILNVHKKQEPPPPPPRPKIPVPSEEEDIADDLELDPLDFDDFSDLPDPPPVPDPPPPLDLKVIPKIILGCTDPEAPNYNPEANQDDGSCQLPPGEYPPTEWPTEDEDIAGDLDLDELKFEDFSNLDKPPPPPGPPPPLKVTGLLQLPKKTPPVTILPEVKTPILKKSTYAGTYAQNYSLLYKVTPWYNSKQFTKTISYYGENPGSSVDYAIRQKFWDEMIEPPNVSGESKWGDDKELLDKVVDEWPGPTWVISPGGKQGSTLDESKEPSSPTFSPAQFDGDSDDFTYNTWIPKTVISQARILGVGQSRGFPYPENGTVIRFPSYGMKIDKQGNMIKGYTGD